MVAGMHASSTKPIYRCSESSNLIIQGRCIMKLLPVFPRAIVLLSCCSCLEGRGAQSSRRTFLSCNLSLPVRLLSGDVITPLASCLPLSLSSLDDCTSNMLLLLCVHARARGFHLPGPSLCVCALPFSLFSLLRYCITLRPGGVCCATDTS